MNFVATYSHHDGVGIWESRDLYEWATDIFVAPDVPVREKSTREIRDYVESELNAAGWASKVKIDAKVDLTVFARKEDMAFQLQTGNISRYAYDLLKLQHLYASREIECGILAVATKEAAAKLGSNIAQVERIWEELKVFDRIISVPLMLIAFD